MAEKNTLSRNKERALRALLSCATIKEAARAAGLGVRTCQRYLTDAAFVGELHARQDALMDAATAGLSGLLGDSIATLAAALKAVDASWPARIRAAVSILEHARRLTEFADLERRISDLERDVYK